MKVHAKIVLALSCLSTLAASKAQEKRVGIVQVVRHPSLDALREQAIAQVHRLSTVPIRVDYKNAGGNTALLGQIAAQMRQSSRYDVILAIGTPAAQAAVARNTKTPVVFAPITDPVKAGLVKSLNQPGGIATGTSDAVGYGKLVAMIRQLAPGIKKLGVPYNAGEVNSVQAFADLQQAAAQQQVEAVAIPVVDISSINQAVKTAIAKGIKGLALIQDNTVASAVENVVSIATRHKVSVFSSYSAACEQGAAAALGSDYKELGVVTGNVILRVLAGESPSKIPVESMPGSRLYLNFKYADKMGLRFSPEVLAEAAEVYHRPIDSAS